MTIRVELNPEMEGQLAAEVLARGIGLELYAQRLLQEAWRPEAMGGRALVKKNFEPFWMFWRARRPISPNYGPRPSRAK